MKGLGGCRGHEEAQEAAGDSYNENGMKHGAQKRRVREGFWQVRACRRGHEEAYEAAGDSAELVQ